jgi:RND family efflux transporter MFP subunit
MSHDVAPPKPGEGPPPLSGRKALVLVIALIGAAVAIAILGIVPRVRARTTLQQQTDALAAPDVLVAAPTLGKVGQEVVLPGNVQAFTDAPIYARTSGYLKSWSFDIGAHVKKGQRLAVIASPEVDQQLQQAKADVATAKANSKYAETQSTRYQDLLTENAVSKQDTDNFRAQANSTSNQVAAAEANARRLAQLTGFQTIFAPFDGVITARNVDIGTLIDAGANRELFHLASDAVLRVYVNVPQVYSRATVAGVKAGLTVPEHPGRVFEGKIVRTSQAIDPAFRTLLVEVEVDNRDHQLLPGAYAQVHFKLANGNPTLVLPVPTLIFRSEGLRVAVVRDGKARLVPITIGRDDGRRSR